MNALEQSEVGNESLERLYGPILDVWKNLKSEGRDLSIPMFASSTPAYFAARPRIVFVGQETHGWWTNCGIESRLLTARDIMDFYQSPEINEFRARTRSPYWNAIKRIVDGINSNDFLRSILTLNLFLSDSNRGRAPDELLGFMRDWRALPQELKILGPQIVVFFAGPVYSYNLEYFFGKKLEPGLSKSNPIQEYSPEGVEWKGIVTYHPAYLRRSGIEKLAIPRIIEFIRSSIAEKDLKGVLHLA